MANKTYHNDYSNNSVHGGSFTDGDVLVDTHVNFNLDDLALATKYQADLEAQTTAQTIKSNIAIAKAQTLSNELETFLNHNFKEKIYQHGKTALILGGIGYVVYKTYKGGKK
jgi:hypothetical protein